MQRLTFVVAAGLSLNLIAACSGPIIIDAGGTEDAVGRLIAAVGTIQTRSQSLPPVLVERGDTIIIDNRVTIIEDPARDIVVVELPDRTVLGFENDTGWDIYLKYYADDEPQGVYVYDGEVLLLAYPCLSVIELISEDDIDPGTGVLVDTFDFTGADFFNPEDFGCGDAFILNIDPSSVSARTEVIDLLY
jgi:hypothetical protein